MNQNSTIEKWALQVSTFNSSSNSRGKGRDRGKGRGDWSRQVKTDDDQGKGKGWDQHIDKSKVEYFICH